MHKCKFGDIKMIKRLTNCRESFDKMLREFFTGQVHFYHHHSHKLYFVLSQHVEKLMQVIIYLTCYIISFIFYRMFKYYQLP